jgi:glycosyltransferase involved in cell wall biosynthesis
MRIALLDPPNFTPPYDHSLATALARRGHYVDLLVSPELLGRRRQPDGYRRHETFLTLSGRLLRGRARSPLRLAVKGAEYAPSVRRSLRRLDLLAPDVVHVQWLAVPRYDVRWLRSLARRYPVVLTAHDVRARRSWNEAAWLEALRLADRVVVHSERGVEELVVAGVGRPRLVRVTHPVFDAPPGYEPSEPGGATLLFFGLLRSYKGVDVLLRALGPIARAVPGARLVVAGRPLEPAEPLRALADELGLDGRVEWRLGFVPETEVPALFDEAAAVVCPYRELDSSGVLATALGFGRPAVVSDVGSLGPIVREFGAGRVVRPGDPDALAAACIDLLSDPVALARAAEGARAARGALTWEAAAAEHERVYAEVIAERA